MTVTTVAETTREQTPDRDETWERVLETAQTAINAAYGTDERHHLLARAIADNITCGTALPWGLARHFGRLNSDTATPSGDPAPESAGSPGTARVEAYEWIVFPTGIENTRFHDPESFYLTIRRGRWDGTDVYLVHPSARQLAFTPAGDLVLLRHPTEGPTARLSSFTEARDLAVSIADGHLKTANYTTWQAAEKRHFGTDAKDTP